jgi:hypothetical protein
LHVWKVADAGFQAVQRLHSRFVPLPAALRRPLETGRPDFENRPHAAF